MLRFLSFVALASPAIAQNVGHIWEPLTPAPQARFEGPTIPIDGLLYVFGGFGNAAIQVTSRVDVYDPATDSWSSKADMPIPVTHVVMARDDREIWMLGGFVGDNPGVATTDVWVYDIDLDTWTQGPSLPRPIAGGGGGRVGRMLHYYGGVEIDRDTTTGDHWVLPLDAPQTGWMPLAPMPEPRCHFSGLEFGGELYAIGGQYRHDTNPADQDFMHVFDPSSGAWAAGPALPAARSHAEPGTYVQDGKIRVAGGKSTPQDRLVLSDEFVFDPQTQEWSFGVPLPAPRYGVGVQVLGDYVYFTCGAYTINRPQTTTFRRHKDALLPNPIRINAGGNEYVSPSTGFEWTGDFLSEHGEVRTFWGSAVAGTNDLPLFTIQRRGSSTWEPQRLLYRLPTGPGVYRCRAHFAELDHSSAGARRIDLLVEGDALVEDLDIAADPGPGIAFSRAFDVRVEDDELDFEVFAASDRPSLAALEFELLAPDHFEYECTSNVNSTGVPATIDFYGSTSLADDRLTLLALDVPTNTFCVFFQGQGAVQQAIPGGIICVNQPQYRHVPAAAAGNTVEYLLRPSAPPVPAAQITAGSTWRFQGWFRDGGTNPQWGFTNALKLVFTP